MRRTGNDGGALPFLARVRAIERRVKSEVVAEPVNERDWVRISLRDASLVEAVLAFCTPEVVILG